MAWRSVTGFEVHIRSNRPFYHSESIDQTRTGLSAELTEVLIEAEALVVVQSAAGGGTKPLPALGTKGLSRAGRNGSSGQTKP